ncbi:dTDP-4-dehydrorhamnose reductase [Marinicrinis lubricantis]|uniref:dTDP-4-dehydrorhamnose reductase n=1 Tax=Marinicrinis lubricantis TaxID=2086470 RepID=A0ABW1IJV8_9BACL
MDKLTVVVTGAEGQLGKDLVTLLSESGHHVIGFGRRGLDVTDLVHVQKTISEIRPDVVVHSGAYTKVDQAESEPEQAYLVNGYGTRNVAVASQAVGAKLVYVSTDYVLNGQGAAPFDEFALTDPLNVYGRSKWMGEQFVQQLHTRYFIARTSWVYGQHGNNFVKTMLKLGRQQSEVSVVNDQFGCPTYAWDLAQVISDLIVTDQYGVYHVSNTGSCTWFEFAQAIFECSSMNVRVLPVSSEEFQRPAKRPAFSVFDHQALRLGGFKLPRHWKEALQAFLIEHDIGGEAAHEDRSALGRIG